jgi:hypothetical protein
MIGLGLLAVLLTAVWGFSVHLIQAELKKGRNSGESTQALLSKISDSQIPEFSFEHLEERFAEILQDLIEDTMGNMQMPSATDHIFGAISNIIQHKFMSSIPPGLAEMIPEVEIGDAESVHHGPPQV